LIWGKVGVVARASVLRESNLSIITSVAASEQLRITSN